MNLFSKKKKTIKDLEVSLISIVTKGFSPVNGYGAIVKGEGQRFLKAEKTTKEGLIYVTVMAPNEVDKEGDVFTPEAIKKAAHNFLGNGKVKNIDENHNLEIAKGVKVVESYLDNSGKWLAVIDVSENADLMQKAQNDEIEGVSIYGRNLTKGLDLREKKETNEAYDKLIKTIYAFQDVAWETLQDEEMTESDKKRTLELNVSQLFDLLNKEIDTIFNSEQITKNFENKEAVMPLTKEDLTHIGKMINDGIQKAFEKKEADAEAIAKAQADKEKITNLESQIDELKKAIADGNKAPAGENPDNTRTTEEIVKGFKI